MQLIGLVLCSPTTAILFFMLEMLIDIFIDICMPAMNNMFCFFLCNLGPPSLVVGESGGVKLYSITQHSGTVLNWTFFDFIY